MFDLASSAGLDGPDWLRVRRAAAVDRLSDAELPTADEEIWRYSPIGDLDPDRWDPAAPATDVAPDGLVHRDGVEPDGAVVVRVRNGRITAVDGVQPRGLQVGHLADVADGDEVLGRAMTSPTDVFAEANLALAADPIVVRVAAGATLPGPVMVDQWIDADGGAIFPRLVVVVGEDAEATVVDSHSSADIAAFTAPVTELVLEQASRLRFLTVQDLAQSVWHIGSQVAEIGRDAQLLTTLAVLGGGYARHRIDTRMVGAGAQGDIVAVYHGEHDQALDFRTFQQHVAPHTRSELLFKGSVDDRSRAIYTGLIRIEKDAADVSAFQTNRNLKLSPDAWAQSVPNLEIENNDVRCSHASAVGPVDEDQRFYLESRGVPTAVAERLVVLGFYQEVLERLPVPSIAAAIGLILAERLDAGDDG